MTHRVLAICGHRNSGKTTLLESAVRELTKDGLRVAWVKRTHHTLVIDQEGKDSDRLFSAGADVGMGSETQHMLRRHPSDLTTRMSVIHDLLQTHDFVLVEGGKPLPLPKVWLAREGEPDPPPDLDDIIVTLPWDGQRLEPLLNMVHDRLRISWEQRPLLAGVLLGGKSTRMGKAKQCIEWRGRSLTRHIVDTVKNSVEQVVTLGNSDAPKDCGEFVQLPDSPDLTGPLAGILTAMRWAPEATWLFLACDMPLFNTTALEWLLSQRHPGRWGVFATLDGIHPEPMGAICEPMFRASIEMIACSGKPAPRLITKHSKSVMLKPREDLHLAWTNINTPEDLDNLTS